MKKEKITYFQAIQKLKNYADNFNPTTGEVLDSNHLIDDDLKVLIRKVCNPDLDDLKMMMNHICGFPFRRGFSWTKQEEDEVILNFEKGMPFRDIAKSQKRSTTAIMKRLKDKGYISKEVKLPQRSNLKSFSIYYS